MATQKKDKVDVRDLKPSKDAKGGGGKGLAQGGGGKGLSQGTTGKSTSQGTTGKTHLQ